jgi:hypothetical protein
MLADRQGWYGLRKVKLGSRSGLFESLRYRVHQLVSRVSSIKFVSRSLPVNPAAVLPGIVAKVLRSTNFRFQVCFQESCVTEMDFLVSRPSGRRGLIAILKKSSGK